MEAIKKKITVPHTYVILFSIIVIMALCSYILPAGEYERIKDPQTGRTIVAAESFKYVEQHPVAPFDVLRAVHKGMVTAGDIIFFIFIVGGSFNVVLATGSINAGIGRIARIASGREVILVPLVLFVFSLGGATFGMSEEAIVFIPIGIALARAVGYDAITGCAIVALGAACGFNSGMMNPFTVGVAQGIAELPLFSGIGLRIVLLFVLLTVTTLYILRYAKRVKADPSYSIVSDLEREESNKVIDVNNLPDMTLRDKLVLLCVIASIALLAYSVYAFGWYIREISALFLALAIVCGFIGGFGPSRIAREFVAGAKDLAFGALVCGFARAILVVMQDGVIIDTIVYGLASVISTLPESVSAVGMYLVQVVINFFIPSGSGQATTTMPIMVPLSDVIGLTRQTAVLAFQMGDGFTNSIIPTSATLMGNLSVAKIGYDKWLKFITPLMIIWIVIGVFFMIYASHTSYGPF